MPPTCRLHLHTHDTSGISGASVLAAVEAGVDAVDAAMDAMSGMTSQPALARSSPRLEGTDRDHRSRHGRDPQDLVRLGGHSPSVHGLRKRSEGPASEVYLHEMPGGQFTNLKEQARSLGLANRWHEVAKTYAEVNQMFGDIVKVTPSSKVVGDMALMMVSQGITADEVMDPDKDIAFPESVVSMMRGDLGQPPGGWPEVIQAKVLKGDTPYTERPGARLEPADLDAERASIAGTLERDISDQELASYLMYPKVFTEFARVTDTYGPVGVLPTPVYFYGLEVEDEIAIELEKGKTLVVRCLGKSEPMKPAWSVCSSSSTASRAPSRCPIAAMAPRARARAAKPMPTMMPMWPHRFQVSSRPFRSNQAMRSKRATRCLASKR
jgi:pyruvate carboxylase